jgi:hypothetical protein
MVPVQRHGFRRLGNGFGVALPDSRLQRITQLDSLVSRQFHNKPAAAFQRDAHYDAAALLGHLERAIARPRLHRRHPASPSFMRTYQMVLAAVAPVRSFANRERQPPRAGRIRPAPPGRADRNNRVDPSPYYPVFGRRMVMIGCARRPRTRRKPPAGAVPEPLQARAPPTAAAPPPAWYACAR